MRIWCDKIFKLVLFCFVFSSPFISLCSHRVAIRTDEMSAFYLVEDNRAFLSRPHKESVICEQQYTELNRWKFVFQKCRVC